MTAGNITGLNEYSRLRQVALRPPLAALLSQRNIDSSWRALNYHCAPDFDLSIREHDALAKVLRKAGAEIVELPTDPALTLDSLYVRDASVLAPSGIVLCAMGKPARAGEPAVNGRALAAAGIPVLGAITGDGRLEGGDLIWLDEGHAAIGRGYRTNDEGIRQFKEFLGPAVHVEIVVLPNYKGPGDVFHLMSIISPIDADLQLVYSPLMPVSFREWLLARGQRLIEVPDAEFPTMGCNVLAIAPREVVMLRGNPVTEARLREAGCLAHAIAADAISVPGQGGPTCLTRPIRRS